jgi:hypothetical protein
LRFEEDFMRRLILSTPIRFGLLCCGALFILSLLTCSDDDSSSPGDEVDNTNYAASEDFSFSFEAAARTRFRLSGINGPVEITGMAASDSIKIWGERRVESESVADAEAHLSELEVLVSEGSSEISVRTEQPDETRGRNFIVEYNVEFPSDFDVVVSNLNGNITILWVNGTIDLDLTNGNASIEEARGDLSLDVTNGNILLDEIDANVNADLINGTIDSDVAIPAGGSCMLDIINGRIDLVIPRSTSAIFSASVTYGSISVTNLDLQGQVVTPTNVTGTLGDGDGTINLDVVNGQIVVVGEPG